MSKKIAEGAAGLVLDVKVGSGAFMKDVDRARSLAETMVEIGGAAGVHPVALLTAMDRPLGRAVGNALEVAESLEVLAGGGPADVVELTVLLAREMLALAGLSDVDPAIALRDGRAMDVLAAMIAAQGGDPAAALPVAGEVQIVPAPASGRLTGLDAYAVGVAAWRLGAGRARKEDRCRRWPASCCARRSATRCKPGSRCSSCTPTTLTGCRPRWTRSTARCRSTGRKYRCRWWLNGWLG